MFFLRNPLFLILLAFSLIFSSCYSAGVKDENSHKADLYGGGYYVPYGEVHGTHFNNGKNYGGNHVNNHGGGHERSGNQSGYAGGGYVVGGVSDHGGG